MICVVVGIVILVLLTDTAWSLSAKRSTECIDIQLNSTLEYVSIVRYKSVGSLKKEHACYMITQCSVDRLPRLVTQIKAWGGATSTAVHIPTTDHVIQMQSLRAIDTFMRILRDDAAYSGWLTISLLFGHEATPQLWNCTEPKSPGMPMYPINALRNLAVAATGGDPHLDAHHIPPYLLYLDVDFVPSHGLSAWIDHQVQGPAKSTFHKITGSGSVIVLPAFESSATIPHTPTRSLHYLLSGIKAGTIRQFHGQNFSMGHAPTDYDRWKKLSGALDPRKEFHTAEPYKVEFWFYYEPYVLLARQFFVPYDEQFRGYGLNKCVNIRWLKENGTEFYVLPGHFVVEDEHSKRFAHNMGYTAPLYQRAVRAMKSTPKHMPAVSQNTAELLRAAGFGKVATEDPAAQEAYKRSIGELL